jgi:hypothetical protein
LNVRGNDDLSTGISMQVLNDSGSFTLVARNDNWVGVNTSTAFGIEKLGVDGSIIASAGINLGGQTGLTNNTLNFQTIGVGGAPAGAIRMGSILRMRDAGSNETELVGNKLHLQSASANDLGQFDNNSVGGSGNTRFLLYDVDAGTLKRVLISSDTDTGGKNILVV